MKISSCLPVPHLRAADLDGPTEVTIDRFELEVDDDGNESPVLHFKETDQPLILKRQNAWDLRRSYGDETDRWAGKPLILVPVEFWIRVMVPKKRPARRRAK